MNQTSLVGRPLAALATAVVKFAERRGVWSGPLTSSSPELARLWSAPTSSTGIAVSEETMLTYSAVWGAVTLISSQVASLPLFLYKRLPNGGKQRLSDHKLYRVLHDEPNREMTAFQFREALMAHVLTWGNGYAEIVRNGAGGVASLELITPDRVTARRDTRSSVLYYAVSREDGGIDHVQASDMVHIAGLGFDGIVGYSVIAKQRESIGLGLATERFGGTFFGNGSTFGGVISLGPGEQLTEAAKKNFREMNDAAHQGVERSHKWLLLANQAKYERIGIPPNDAQFLETRKFQVEEVARWFNLAPYKLRRTEGTASYASIEQQAIEHVTDCLRQWLVRVEQEFNRKLISPFERNIQFTEHLIDGLLRGDQKSRYDAYAVARQWGWLSVDEIRERENLNPLPNNQGQIYLVPMNYSPADRLNDIIDNQLKPKPAPNAPVAQPKTASERAEDAAEMVGLIRTALVDVETRIAATTGKITAAEADASKWKDSAGTLEADLTQHRASLATEQAEANRLRAVLLEATERADRLAIEQEALKLSVTAAEARALAADQVIASTAAQLETAKTATATLQAERDQLQIQHEAATTEAARVLADYKTQLATVEQASVAERASVEQRLAEQGDRVIAVALERDAKLAVLTALETELSDAKAQSLTLSAELDALRAEASAAISAVEATKLVAADAIDAEKDLRTAAEQANAEYATQLAQEQAARAEIETRFEALRVEASEAAKRAGSAVATADTATAELTALRTAAEQSATTHAAQLTTEHAAKAALQTTLQAQAEAHSQLVEAIRLAQRESVIDTMERVVRVECDRARRNQGTPAKLKAWAEAFYMQQEDRYVEALRSDLRAYLVTVGSTQDVDTYTRSLIAPQLLEAVTQIRTLCEGDPEDFAVSLDRVLEKWEKDRPSAIGDRVFLRR